MIHRINDRFYLFGGIKGLVRDGDELRKELLKIRPDVVFITISPEQVEGMKEFIDDPFEMNLSDYEIMYGINLSNYGEVMTPSPVYIEATKYCKENGIEMIGLDMEEGEYQRIYSKYVKTTDLLRHSMRKKKISKIKFNAETPEEFVKAWNDSVDLKSFKRVNAERENYMIERIGNLYGEYKEKKIICIVDYDYYDNILNHIEKIPKDNT
jgi:chemotaxis response regulator CheB